MVAALTLAVAVFAVPSAAAEQVEGTVIVVVDRDLDADGVYDLGDRPQPGIEITVSDPSGVVAAGTTDESGRFVVVPATKGLSGGRYFVVADIPAAFSLTPVPASDSFQPLSTTVDVTTGDKLVRLGVAARRVSEPPAEPTPAPQPPEKPALSTVPAAEPRFAVGDRVWQDLDRQGRQDEHEPPAVDTSVQLLDASGGVLRSTRTDAAGRYLFDDLPAGLYSVRFAGIRTERRLSPAGVGNAAGDSDPDYTGVTPPFELATGAPDVRAVRDDDGVRADYINTTIDAGIAPLAYAVASVVLPAGEYRLRFTELGEHRRLTTARVGSNPALDSDPERNSGLTRPFTLKAGAPGVVPAADVGPVDADFVDPTHSAGVMASYAVSNRVWDDNNGDGLLSTGEKGIQGVRVELVDLSGNAVAATTTAANGGYRFDGLAAGQYRLWFRRIPQGLHVTTPGVGADRWLDSVDSDTWTAPIAVGEDQPVEEGLSAGLTRSAATTTSAPTSTGPAASAAAGPASSTGGPSVLLPVAGVLLGLLGAALVLRRRLRHR